MYSAAFNRRYNSTDLMTESEEFFHANDVSAQAFHLTPLIFSSNEHSVILRAQCAYDILLNERKSGHALCCSNWGVKLLACMFKFTTTAVLQ